MNELPLRKAIIATALAMNALGINRGKSGNVSARWKDGFLITPSGLPYEESHVGDKSESGGEVTTDSGFYPRMFFALALPPRPQRPLR